MTRDEIRDETPAVRDPWSALRALTPARIALGRAGASLPTRPHLDFQLAHARARTAVHRPLDGEALRAALSPLGLGVLTLESAAEDRTVYLQRPDLGRQLSVRSRALLEAEARPERASEVVFVVADGLSALAVERNAAPFLAVMLPVLRAEGWEIGPLAVVTQARVACGDEVGERLGARMVILLIGERPGLSSPDSMGIYMTANPRAGLTDEARNCISNVRDGGLSVAAAAHKLLFLMTEARRLGLSGVTLKDGSATLAPEGLAVSRNFLLPAR